MRSTPYWLAFAVCIGAGCQRGTEQRPAEGQETTSEHVPMRKEESSGQQLMRAQASAASRGQDSTAVDHGLQMTASPLRKVYPLDGPMEVQLTFHNLSDSMVVFRPIFYFGVWLDADIIDSAGRAVPRTMEITPPSPLNTLETFIRPRQSISAVVNLRCAIPSSSLPCEGPYDALSEPGTYQVKMRFTLPCQENKCMTVVAEPFAIRVERKR